MPKLIIANNDTDSMVADPRARTSNFMGDFAKVAGRMMWFWHKAGELIGSAYVCWRTVLAMAKRNGSESIRLMDY